MSEPTVSSTKPTASETGNRLTLHAPQTADDRAEAVRLEYSKYVANQNIPYGNALAYTTGMAVATGAVEGENAWVDPAQVDKVTTKAGQKSIATAGGLEVKD
jgi:hypothetical protein